MDARSEPDGGTLTQCEGGEGREGKWSEILKWWHWAGACFLPFKSLRSSGDWTY